MIRVDLKEKDWINNHHRESAVTKYALSLSSESSDVFCRYNSAKLPASLKPEDVSMMKLFHLFFFFVVE